MRGFSADGEYDEVFHVLAHTHPGDFVAIQRLLDKVKLEYGVEEEAATKIQAGWRGHQARKKLKREKAAAVLQTGWRRYQVRKKLKEERAAAATKIQALVRGIQTRKRLVAAQEKECFAFEAETTLLQWAKRCFRELKEFDHMMDDMTPDEFKTGFLSKLEFESLVGKFIDCMEINLSNERRWCPVHGKIGEEIKTDKKLPEEYFDLDKDIYDYRYVQKEVVPSGSKIIVIGDIHGSVHSLLRDLLRLKESGYLNDNFKLSDKCYLIFTGDYVDRGRYGAEVWYTLMNLKVVNPDKVFLLQGNHEDECMCEEYGFDMELKSKFENEFRFVMYSLFRVLPWVVYVGSGNDFIQFCHGGIEIGFNPKVLLEAGSGIRYQKITHFNRKTTLDLLKKARVLIYTREWPVQYKEDNVSVFLALSNGFNWTDFKDGDEFGFNRDRRCGFTVGVDILPDIFNTFNLTGKKIKAVFRGHQHNENAVSFVKRKMFLSARGELTSGFVWTGLQRQQKSLVNRHNVYTFMSCPEGLGGDCDVDGYGVIKIDSKYSSETLKSYEYPLQSRRNGKYVHFDFKTGTCKWEREPLLS